MKISTCIVSLSLFAVPIVHAAAAADLSISEKGPHHRVWSKTVQEQLPNGKTVTRVKPAYTELATGMHYWSDDQKDWVESSEVIEIVNGMGMARHGQHTVSWAANANTEGAVDLQSADGKRFRSHVLGLAFTDAKTGASVFFGTIKDSIGEVVGNQVIYRDAFDGINADILYTYTRAKFEQDIILREALPDPSAQPWNLDPATVLVEVYTEFLDPPDATVVSVTLESEADPAVRQGMVEPDFVDQYLDFGAMKIGMGTAFLTGGGQGGGIPVAKSFEVRDQRHVLIEKLQYRSAQQELALLAKPAPLTKEQVAKIERGIERDKNGVPKARLPKTPKVAANLKSAPIRTAQIIVPTKGFVLDYSQVNTASNLTFQADSTYYVSGGVTLSGTTTIEGGCVVKYAPTNTAKINITGSVNCLTGPYRVAIFTARDDSSVGETIGTNSLSGFYASGALYFDSTSSTGVSLSNLRISYASGGITFQYATNSVISHVQFVKCDTAILTYAGDFSARNVLVDKANVLVSGSATPKVRFEHLTAREVGTFGGITTFFLTNSLLVAVTNMATYTGSNVQTNSDPSLVFVTVGAAGHYLTNNSSYRDAGTTNINPSLAADLKKKTTYPPTVMAIDNWYTTNLTLSPFVQRDTDTPDLGYHYDPLDYCISGMALSNATLTITAGTAIGAFQSPNISYSICPLVGAKAYGTGSPTNLIHIARYNTVQEQANTNWSSSRGASVLTTFTGSSPQPEARFSFTDWSTPASDVIHVYGYNSGNGLPVVLTDSQIHGGSVVGNGPSFNVTNSLFERVDIELTDSYGVFDVNFQNNLFYGGTNWLEHLDAGSWRYRDNFFHNTKISTTVDPVDTDYNNGYLTNSQHLLSVATNSILVLTNTSISFQTSWLGRFYLPTNSLLIDRGSTNANSVGLYHYTSVTNQVKETNSTVNIGFHYVAVDSNGIPLDADGDGVPDYQEDANGNGSVNSGETDWQSAGDFGLRVRITYPRQ